jgi:hypothetical protein
MPEPHDDATWRALRRIAAHCVRFWRTCAAYERWRGDAEAAHLAECKACEIERENGLPLKATGVADVAP